MEQKKQTLITDFFVKKNNENLIKGYNIKTKSWHCLECGIDMGQNNSRQLCGKSRCIFSLIAMYF